tara:strand:- start:420 stop:674 length:255 start_codon:yes stop_codon:yes gene_type:complete
METAEVVLEPITYRGNDVVVDDDHRVAIFRKSKHFFEPPIQVDVESARASISAWRYDVDKSIEKLLAGGMVSTRNHKFYGQIIV